MNVLLVAEESAGIQVLRALVRLRHHAVAVMTAPPNHGGGATVSSLAGTLGVPILPSAMVREPDLADWVRSEQTDVLLNVHSLHVIQADVVAAPRIGSFNLHPGPLPEYAGLNAPSWAIYLGERRHAVTLHWMDPAIDAGPIAYTSSFEITREDTGLSVSAQCVRTGLPLVERLLEVAAEDPTAIPVIPQDLSKRRYFGRTEVPDGGAIIWSRPARAVVDLVRACDFSPFASPWGQPRARLHGGLISVTKASPTGEPTKAEPGTVGRAAGDSVRVATGDEWILVRRLQLDGAAAPAASVLEPGMRLSDG